MEPNKNTLIKVINEYNSLGEEEFLKLYKYGKNIKYELIFENKSYPPKAIWGRAYEILNPNKEFKTFESGKRRAFGKPEIEKLESMGFLTNELEVENLSIQKVRNEKLLDKANSLGINNYWWSDKERYWMEVTNRDQSEEISLERGDIGENIWAPHFDTKGNKRIPSYSLVSLVKPGDYIFHYSKTKNAIIGFSIAIGYAYDDFESWGSQGSIETANKPFNRDVFKVDLSNFTEFDVPLNIQEIRKKTHEIAKSIKEIKDLTKGAAYAPFVIKNNQLEPPQGYLFKMPKNIAEILNLIERNNEKINESQAAVSKESAVSRTSSKKKIDGKSRYKRNKLKEIRGMEIATKYFEEEGWTVEDTSETTVDLTCYKGEEILFVEVKATHQKWSSAKVQLTKNEVNFHKMETSNALFILTEVKIIKEENTETAKGGIGHVLYNWEPKDENLTATIYDYIPEYQEFKEIGEFN
jgi:hypothetical protein